MLSCHIFTRSLAQFEQLRGFSHLYRDAFFFFLFPVCIESVTLLLNGTEFLWQKGQKAYEATNQSHFWSAKKCFPSFLTVEKHLAHDDMFLWSSIWNRDVIAIQVEAERKNATLLTLPCHKVFA